MPIQKMHFSLSFSFYKLLRTAPKNPIYLKAFICYARLRGHNTVPQKKLGEQHLTAFFQRWKHANGRRRNSYLQPNLLNVW